MKAAGFETVETLCSSFPLAKIEVGRSMLRLTEQAVLARAAFARDTRAELAGGVLATVAEPFAPSGDGLTTASFGGTPRQGKGGDDEDSAWVSHGPHRRYHVSSARRPVIAVFQDPDLCAEDSPGEGWAPVHAAQLLGELADPRAVEPLLQEILEGDWDSYVSDAASTALPRHGAAALEPLLRAHDAEQDPFERALLCLPLSDLGVRDERVYERLVACLRSHPDIGAGSLGAYGDPRAVPLLYEAFDAVGNRAPLHTQGAVSAVSLRVRSGTRSGSSPSRAPLGARRGPRAGRS